MLIAFLLSLFLSGQQEPNKELCKYATGMIGVSDWDHLVFFYANPPGPEDPFVSIWRDCPHESGGELLKRENRRSLAGRYAKICNNSNHAYEHYHHTPVVIGGMHPDDFYMAMAVEKFAFDASAGEKKNNLKLLRKKPTLPESLINIGLASRGYYTREASYRMLSNMGLSILPEIYKGAQSRDMEVKTRCDSLLNQLLVGDPPPVLPIDEPIKKDIEW